MDLSRATPIAYSATTVLPDPVGAATKTLSPKSIASKAET